VPNDYIGERIQSSSSRIEPLEACDYWLCS
jgi:hypothetical protein